MSRLVRLVRRVTAGAGGFAGDSAWSEGSPPANPASPAVSVGSPVFAIPSNLTRDTDVAARGCAGYVRVTGADATRTFELRIYAEWVRDVDGVLTRDWRLLSDPDDVRIVSNGEDFTTDPSDLGNQKIAFHLTPVGGNLASGSVVEVWAAEI